MSRRVLMIAASFPPENSAGVHRTARFCRMLPEFGWTPIVLTKSPDDGAVRPEWLAGVSVTRVTEGGTAAGSNGRAVEVAASEKIPAKRDWKAAIGPLRDLARNARELLVETPDKSVSWSRRVRSVAKDLAQTNQVDAIYTTGPPHSTHLVGRSLKRGMGLPWIADFRDPWARRPWGPKEQNPWGQRMLWRYEQQCVLDANLVVLNTSRMAQEFREHYHRLPAERFVSIPNGWDPDLADVIQQFCNDAESARASMPKGALRICHPGSLYRKRDPRVVIDAIEILKRRGVNVCFEQIGHCENESDVREHVRRLGLEASIEFRPQMPHREVLRRMADADAFLLIQPGTPTQVPGKLFEMIQYRRPIVAVADPGETADIIAKYRLGAVAASHNADEIAGAIEAAALRTAGESMRPDWAGVLDSADGRRLTGELSEALNASTAKGRRS